MQLKNEQIENKIEISFCHKIDRRTMFVWRTDHESLSGHMCVHVYLSNLVGDAHVIALNDISPI